MSEKRTKGNKVELKTFESWGKSDILGWKTEEKDGKVLVNYVWCKVCARYKTEITSRLKGNAKTAALAFINGTNVVTKYQVRDFNSKRLF